MNRIRTALVVAALVVVSLTSSGPATAGGPTSALLSVPGQGRTASLYYTDPEYDALSRRLGITDGSGTGEADRSGVGHASGPGVTVTWLIHDVDPWRVDRIYPDGKGAVWVATQVAGESGSIWNSPVAWHRPDAGRAILRLLDRLGVGEAARATDDFTGVAGEPVPPPAGTEPVADESAAPTEPSSADRLSWALAGLVGGVLATLAGVRLRRRGTTPSTADPGDQPAPATADTGIVVAEEMSWPAPRA